MEENDHLWCARPQLFVGKIWTVLCLLYVAPGAWDRRPSGTQHVAQQHGPDLTPCAWGGLGKRVAVQSP